MTRKFLLIAALVGLLISGSVIAQEDPTPLSPEGEAPADVAEPIADEGPTLETVTADSTAYYGQEVVLEGVIEEFLNRRTFILGEGAELDNDMVLVINNAAQELPLNLVVGERVQIRGIIAPPYIDGGLEGVLNNYINMTANMVPQQPEVQEEPATEETMTEEGAEATPTMAAEGEEPTTEEGAEASPTMAAEGEEPATEEGTEAEQPTTEEGAEATPTMAAEGEEPVTEEGAGDEATAGEVAPEATEETMVEEGAEATPTMAAEGEEPATEEGTDDVVTEGEGVDTDTTVEGTEGEAEEGTMEEVTATPVSETPAPVMTPEQVDFTPLAQEVEERFGNFTILEITSVDSITYIPPENME